MKRLLPLALLLAVARPAAAIPQPPHDKAVGGVECLDCHIPYASLSVPGDGDGVAAAGSSATTLVDATAAWTPTQWIGGVVTILSGPNLGEFREISAGTATSVSWELPLPVALVPGVTFQLGKTTRADVETKCRGCHNPTGTAPTMVNFAFHEVRGDRTITCGKCHEPHAVEPSSGPGAALIRTAVRWPTAKAATTFPSSGPVRWITGAPDFDGICETCHTQTAYHRNGPGGDHSHHASTDCSTCHLHERGFTVDCMGCHALPQDDGDGVPPGGRRAVIDEFPGANAHAHYGASLSESSCRSCHDQTTHGDGAVDLLDPDGGATLRFVRWGDVPADPDSSDFCMGCHDADGATALGTPFDPFGAGNAQPNVASRFDGTLRWEEWYGDQCFGEEGTLRRVNSHHDLSSDDQAWSGAKLECLNCHGAHTASATTVLIDPFAPLTAWPDTTNEFCLACHSGGAGPAAPGFPAGVTGPTIPLRGLDSCGYRAGPWYVEYLWTYSAHGLDSKRGWPGYSGAPAHDMDCTACHDPHGSTTPTNLPGNPYALRDEVTGTSFVDDGNRRIGGWNGPPWSTFGVQREVVVPVSGIDVGFGGADGFCATCHADYQAAYEWHDFCSACSTCHSHGANWNENDWPGGGNDTPCPP